MKKLVLIALTVCSSAAFSQEPPTSPAQEQMAEKTSATGAIAKPPPISKQESDKMLDVKKKPGKKNQKKSESPTSPNK